MRQCVDWYQSEGGRLIIILVKTKVPSIGKYVIAVSDSLPYMCYLIIYSTTAIPFGDHVCAKIMEVRFN